MKKISVTTGVFNEELIVRDVYEAVKKVFAESLPQYDYEHIFMDNASTDGTLDILKGIAAKDPRVKIVSYSRNFGPIKSEMVGYYYATGDAVLTLEGNLKDPTELIPAFVRRWEEGYEVVYGIRNRTADNLLLALARKAYYRLMSTIADEKLPLNVGTFRLIDRKVVNELVKLDDYKPYIRGLITSIGFRQIGIEYVRRARPKGTSKSRLTYLIDFAINAVISYSLLPIRLCTYIGLLLAIVSLLAALVYLVLKFFVWPVQIPALGGVIFLILLFSGIQLFFLGVIGEYVGAIHAQVRKKPFVVVREMVNLK